MNLYRNIDFSRFQQGLCTVCFAVAAKEILLQGPGMGCYQTEEEEEEEEERIESEEFAEKQRGVGGSARATTGG